MNLSSYVEQRNMQAVQTENTSQIDIPKDSDFKTYVLYVNDQENRDPLSKMSLEILMKKPNLKKTLLQVNVQTLTSKPAFLETVPLLLNMETKKAYKGEKCIEFLESVKELPSNNRNRKRTNPWV